MKRNVLRFAAVSVLTVVQRIVFGHWSTLGYLRTRDVLCLDGGCVWGGQLCAARLDAEQAPVMLDCSGYRRPGED